MSVETIGEGAHGYGRPQYVTVEALGEIAGCRERGRGVGEERTSSLDPSWKVGDGGLNETPEELACDGMVRVGVREEGGGWVGGNEAAIDDDVAGKGIGKRKTNRR